MCAFGEDRIGFEGIPPDDAGPGILVGLASADAEECLSVFCVLKLGPLFGSGWAGVRLDC